LRNATSCGIAIQGFSAHLPSTRRPLRPALCVLLQNLMTQIITALRRKRYSENNRIALQKGERREETMKEELSEEDLRAALREIKTYVDITEEDLRRIYEIALRHAKERVTAAVPVREVMTREAVTIGKGADVNEAARLLSEDRISGLPVVDDHRHVIGVVSEADILSMTGMKKGHTFKDVVRHLLGEPLPGRKEGALVEDIMSSPAITTTPGTDIAEVARILDDRRIKRLPVVDEEGRLVGIISRADIVRAIRKR
jgi:CBS domain-containing membrane protein